VDLQASYAYDPFGRRIRKTVGGVTTWTVWDGDRLWGEFDGAGNRTRRYAYAGGFAPVQMVEPDGLGGEDVYAVHGDHMDTPFLVTDASGTPVWRAELAAFGEAAVSADPDLDPGTVNPGVGFSIRFPGQDYDDETGLHYNRFRYYSPEIGRYISADPIGQWGDINLYRYAFNDPLNLADPYGLLTWGEAVARYGSRRGGTLDTPFADHDPGFGPESFPGFDEALVNRPGYSGDSVS